MTSSKLYATFVLSFVFVTREVLGHGMMLEPPNRSSMWRFNDSYPVNYEDNQNFCGGFGIQWGVNDGKCGPCGDNWSDPVPRANENTGTYGLGSNDIEFVSGKIDVYIYLSANHLGTFSYSLCNLDSDPSKPETEECFQNLLLANGDKEFKVSPTDKNIINKVVLPKGLTCNRCVLRWHYRTGNNWGTCEDGSGGMGCGPQETFRSCSDMAIV